MIEPFWKGRLRIIESTNSNDISSVEIRLEDSNSGELFVKLPFTSDGKNVESVLDSSRYFVLRVINEENKSTAYLGLGFLERSESFDFNVALQDWSKRELTPSLSSSTSTSSSSTSSTSKPTRDFSLKPGETMKIQVGTKSGSSSSSGNNASVKESVVPNSGRSFLLPPPPPSSRRRD